MNVLTFIWNWIKTAYILGFFFKSSKSYYRVFIPDNMINRVRVRRDFIRFDLTFECFYLSVQMRNSNLNGNTYILAEIKYRDLVLSRLNAIITGFFTSSYIASKHSNFRCRSRSFMPITRLQGHHIHCSYLLASVLYKRLTSVKGGVGNGHIH